MPTVVFERRHAIFAGIWLDCSIEEVHTAAAIVTAHPVEDGSEIVDSIIPQADRIRMRGMVSNTPIELPGSHADGAQVVPKEFEFDLGTPQIVNAVVGGGLLGQAAGAITGALGLNKGGGFASGFDPEFDRVANAYEELLAIKNEGRLFTIETTLRLYEDMALEALEVVRDSQNGNVLHFTADARQVLVVSSETVELPEPQVQRGKAKAEQGKKPTADGGLGAINASAAFNAAGF